MALFLCVLCVLCGLIIRPGKFADFKLVGAEVDQQAMFEP